LHDVATGAVGAAAVAGVVAGVRPAITPAAAATSRTPPRAPVRGQHEDDPEPRLGFSFAWLGDVARIFFTDEGCVGSCRSSGPGIDAAEARCGGSGVAERGARRPGSGAAREVSRRPSGASVPIARSDSTPESAPWTLTSRVSMRRMISGGGASARGPPWP